MRFALLADDLTGACDSAAPFLAAGEVVVSLWPCLPAGDVACLAISTESRGAGAEVAFERSRQGAEGARRLGVDLLYRKVDSQMRGYVGADVAGALSGWGGACVLAPALPEEGRVTIGGRQRWPGGDVDVLALLSEAGLAAFGGGVGDAREGGVVVCDAADESELAVIAEQVALAPGRLLPAGTAGLAARLPGAFGLTARPSAGWPACRNPLAIVGSPAAEEQGRLAARRGRWVLWLGPDELPTSIEGHDGLLVTGGETAARVLRWLGAEALELRGEALPRVPVGICRGGRYDGLPFALKSGAFGPPDAIELALDRLGRDG